MWPGVPLATARARRAPGRSSAALVQLAATVDALDRARSGASPRASSSCRRRGSRRCCVMPDRGGQLRPRGGRPRRRGRRGRRRWSRSAIHASLVPKPARSGGIADGAGDVGVVELEVGAHVDDQRAALGLRCSTWRGVSGWTSTRLAAQRAAVEGDDRLEVRRLRAERGRSSRARTRPRRRSASSALCARSKPIVEETFMSMPGPPHSEPPRWPGQTSHVVGQRRAAARAASGRCRARPPPCRRPGRVARCRRRTACRRSAPPTAPAPRAVSISAKRRVLGPVAGRVQRAHAHAPELELPAVVERLVLVVGRRRARWMWIVAPVAAASRPWPETWSAWLWVSRMCSIRTPEVAREREVLVDVELRVDDRGDAGVLVADRYEAQPRSSWVIWRKIIGPPFACSARGRSGRRAAGGRAAAAATRPSGRAARSSTGTSSSRTSAASSRTATPRITPISFGGSGPGEREGEEDRDHHRGGGEDHAARSARRRRPSPPCGSRAAVPVLLGAREQEHGVVHRDREDHREEEHRRPGVEEALRLEAEQAGQVAVLEDQLGDAERRAGGEQVGEHADGRDHRRLQRDEQQQEAERRGRRR